MKKEKLLKSILTMVVSLAVIATMSGKAFALTSDSINMDDLTGTESGTSTGTGTGTSTDTGTGTSTGTGTNTNTSTGTSTGTATNTNTSGINTNTSTGTNTNKNTNKNTNYNTNLPKAGLAENTVFGVAMVALAAVAVYAYRKIKYYKNI